MTGQRIAHYEILEKLGEGGMGEVYKARDTRLNRLAAIKVLAPGKMADPDRRARFIQEAQAASALNHPNIVTIYGIDRDNDLDFIAMEYVDGRTLDQPIGRRGLKLRETLKYSIQIADALSAAHAAGIVHRDLKPRNVMVTSSGLVKVLDFGLAKLMETTAMADDATRTLHAAPVTEKGAVLGTVSYMSPEQAEGKTVDARSDIFSFGSLLYEMVTGKRAFQGDSKMSTITSILRDEPKSTGQVAAEQVPRDLEKIVARCLRKDVTRRFQHIDDVKVALEELKDESDSGLATAGGVAPRVERRSMLSPFSVAAVLALAVGMAFWWHSRNGGSAGAGGLKLRQLTEDSGLTTYPAISPDGKLLAYASDRAGNAGLDIWVQQLSRGAQPIRLTKDPADEGMPSFSPDGGQIVYASKKNGGGIYVIPSLGGEQRLLIAGDLSNPRFSPDGQLVATSSYNTFTSKVIIVPSVGGAPRSLADAFYTATFRAWSPDGKSLLIVGSKQMGNEIDWWVVPLDGGPAIQTGVAEVLRKSNRNPRGLPLDWLGGYVFYSDGNLWRIPLSPATGKVTGEPERLTTGSDQEVSGRAVALAPPKNEWRIVFASTQSAVNLWSLPMDPNSATVLGEPRKLISDAVRRVSPSLSADGTKLAYVTRGLESSSVRVREVASGAETVLLQQPAEMRARISPDGNQVAFNPSANNEKESVIYTVAATGGESRKLCDACGLIYNWTPDGKKILYRSGNPMAFSALEIATGQREMVLAHPKYHVHGVEFSPDGRWLAFHFAPNPQTPRAIYLAPVHGGKAAGEDEWIAIMNRPGSQTRPWWSPDGNVVYLLSTAGGKTEVWAQRLEPAAKRPVGEPVRIYSPPSERYSIQTGTWFGPGVGARNLIFPIYEDTGNIWIAE